MFIAPYWDSTGATFQIPLPAVKYMNVRIQHDTGSGLNSVEAWDYTGAQIFQSSKSYGDVADADPGVLIGAATVSTAFFRVHSTLVSLNSRPPVTSDHGNLLEWKFDGDLSDASGNGHPASMPSPSYVVTPYQNVIAKAKTANAPAWSDWVSLRAGKPNQLDATASYSQADASAAMQYSWSQTSGSTTLLWDNPAVAMPTIRGAVFGSYSFSLTVTDAASNQGTAALTVGAVAMDDNGVVVNADSNVDKIFGPMIAFGKNPWGYMDERAISATNLRAAAYTTLGINPPSWQTAQSGTVSYIFNGAGAAGAPETTLCSAISSATDTTITLCDATKLDFSSLPTRILVGMAKLEEIRICAANGNALTVCYDGRGINPGTGPDTYRTAAQAWPVGTGAGQMKVTGSGTHFLSVICPAGAGPSGSVKYGSGTVTVQQGSATMTGNGTTWNTLNGVIAGYGIRVQATHGGTPFVFYAYIVTVNGVTGITASRPYPADADSGTFPYQIIAADVRTPVLHYTRVSDGSDAMLAFSSNGCESDTALYLYSGHDISGMDGTFQTGEQYGYAEIPGYTGALGVNFYGEDLAHRALYYRSGWKPALDAANVMSDQYVTSPYLAGGDAGGIPLLYGGGVVGAVAAKVIDNRVSWSDLRGFIQIGAAHASIGCDDSDTRDSSYYLMFLALGAAFDPDPVKRATWVAALRNAYTRDLNCKNTSSDPLLNNSWLTNFNFNATQYPALTATGGSAIMTGANLPQGMCQGQVSGTLTVTSTSSQVTGTGFISGSMIVITGTRGGQTYTGFFEYQLNSSTSITLAGLWPGDSGTAAYVIANGLNLAVIATNNTDSRMGNNWACTWNSSSQITLNRPWVKSGGGSETVYMYVSNLNGRGQQPYMVGMKTLQMRLAALVSDDLTLSANYRALEPLAAQWVKDNGYDPVTRGLYYGRIYGACEPVVAPTTPPPVFMSRNVGCNNGLDPNGIRASRVLTAEGSNALSVLYQNSPTAENKLWGDTAYGSIWGFGPYTTNGVYYDNYYVKDENSDTSLQAYKWTGFFFGMGMSHQWPAARLGGVQPAVTVTAPVTFNLGAASSAMVTVTAPSGAFSQYPCKSSPCQVSLDKRQGAHWVRVSYLNGSGSVLSQDAPILIDPDGTHIVTGATIHGTFIK